jgi:Domain of unknown function (DUF4382)/Domain of unknown function (DUF5666)
MATPRRFFVFFLVVLFLGTTGLLLSCGGGGGSSAGVSGSGGTGSAALLLADGPADDYDHIWIWITRVTLLPADDTGLRPVVIFRSSQPEGYKADLLDLRDQDLLVTVKDRIPAGKYAKIRLEIADIEAEDYDNNAPCSQIEIKLPSGKIDLNPQGGIQVRAGETLAIRLDVDANKSIQLHDAGSSGKCIFRPVVFVDIEPVFVPDRCPRMLSGTIGNLFTDGEETIGFEMILGGGRNPLRVNVDDQTVIFDADTNPVGPEALSTGDPVNVRGRLDGEGELLASMVVIGDVLRVKGTVTGSVVNDTFTIDPTAEQSITGDSMTVALAQDTAIFSDCDTPVGPTYIQEGMGARLFGKLEINGDFSIFRAVAVFLTPKQLTGTITAIDEPTSTSSGSITLFESSPIVVPYDIKPYLVGDGEVPWSLLKAGLECGVENQARIFLDPGESIDTARTIEILPDVLEAVTISTIDAEAGIITTTGGLAIYIQPGATILQSTSGSDSLVSLSAFEPGDTIRVHGLKGCGNPDFFGFILFRDMT